ncbi:hypothetical protein L6259_02255 [Candidatus Parcubacteria bacterium]|nr:hypothetical protein [Patescibacteria group bacterium]MCG2694072.1 hypothetical protein [Candidatus Parcubacteria bacterium]
MEPYREAEGFFCRAQELLEIFFAVEGRGVLKYKSSLINIARIVYGEMIDVDFPFFVILVLKNRKIQKFWQLVEFSKERGIAKRDWLQAIEKICTAVDPTRGL